MARSGHLARSKSSFQPAESLAKYWGCQPAGASMIERIKSSPNAFPQLRRHQDLVEFIREEQPGFVGKVLDVGCGPGYLAKLMREAGFPEVHGVDWGGPSSLIPNSVSSYQQVDLNEQRLEEVVASKFDLIVCSDTLEHLERPAKVIRSMRELLTDTGSLYVTVPNCTNIFQRVSWLLTGNSYRYRTERPGEFGHISLFPSSVMQSLINRAGLKQVRKGKGYIAAAGFITSKGMKFSDFWSYSSYYHFKPVGPKPE
ncbi:class I SAM-dependent methyltransferase [Bradyrhizobium japonicum]|uniref:class I SAM-dependent methyltransferase n=1 Tax=Bradyrhizobium japonicum TaxID=375 RepID=UPI00209E675A|nr:class I SAM-dependent methyltransferase [Bradyrhizobium japonicum]MCP1764434.1 2-polyprenyl-6-hydroxyphenyl methylase/3-demethylubiquinone-9 3-methyltransferase [Bradyrhizobium japonicum]MCP1786572.1 2-polyprenyl-6-hydroxyphenyl methylase/3-demethylubiquinone-9 3-methyltransferase [Bradyrhizobium japonicum]MCP1808450.1 2-polyprenyl-6-hydroxyphenyl methylase/3-demethylubiquinone-9 3-methyltransferase [Bradyrhizobium japonicum]MCP1817377.1 2-polyprenyl-6-hydroxyphenyl methylase/3-demethylubiqu